MRFPVLGLLLALSPGTPLIAQIGYDPYQSPLRSIDRNTWLEAHVGHMSGSGGPIPVGARNGTVMGARVMFRHRSTLQFGLGGWVANAERMVIDANEPVATRVRGPYPQRVIGLETTVQFTLTGGKTWHGLAPYGSMAFGFAMGQKTPASDSSGYAFGTKTIFGPAVGTRIHLGSRISARAEARATIWRVKYPLSYSFEPTEDPGTVGSPNAVNPSGRVGDYTLAPKLWFGLGWAF